MSVLQENSKEKIEVGPVSERGLKRRMQFLTDEESKGSGASSPATPSARVDKDLRRLELKKEPMDVESTKSGSSATPDRGSLEEYIMVEEIKVEVEDDPLKMLGGFHAPTNATLKDEVEDELTHQKIGRQRTPIRRPPAHSSSRDSLIQMKTLGISRNKSSSLGRNNFQRATFCCRSACNTKCVLRGKMTEDKEKTLAFIENYRTYQVLWDNKHKDYTNNTKRYDALTILGRKHNLDVKTVKSKIKSLRSYFSKEHQKVVAKKSGAGAEDNYESSWFAYKSLLFILDSITSRENTETEENTSDNLTELACDASIHDESTDSVTNLSDNEHEFVQPTQTKRNMFKTKRDEREEAYNKTKYIAEQKSNKDECTIFGQLIAHKLRKLNPRNRLLAERRIGNIFFDLELEELDSVALNRVDSTVPPSPSASVYSGYTLKDQTLPRLQHSRNDNTEHTSNTLQQNISKETRHPDYQECSRVSEI